MRFYLYRKDKIWRVTQEVILNADGMGDFWWYAIGSPDHMKSPYMVSFEEEYSLTSIPMTVRKEMGWRGGLEYYAKPPKQTKDGYILQRKEWHVESDYGTTTYLEWRNLPKGLVGYYPEGKRPAFPWKSPKGPWSKSAKKKYRKGTTVQRVRSISKDVQVVPFSGDGGPDHNFYRGDDRYGKGENSVEEFTQKTLDKWKKLIKKEGHK